MTYVDHQYSRVGFDSSVEVKFSSYYGGVSTLVESEDLNP